MPRCRKISGRFLKFIATQKSFTNALGRQSIVIRYAIVPEAVDLSNQNIDPELACEHCYFAGGVNLKGARFDRSVSLKGSNLGQSGMPLKADDVEIGGNLTLEDGYFEAVSLINARVGGNIYARRAYFTETFSADRIKTGGGLYLAHALFNPRSGAESIRLHNARIGAIINAIGAHFSTTIKAFGVEVVSDLFLRGGGVFSHIKLVGATIGGTLQLQGSTFNGEADFTGTIVEQDLMISDPKHDDPRWGANARLILRNTTVNAVQARIPESWQIFKAKKPLPVDLSGFSYRHLGGIRAKDNFDLNEIDADKLIAWIEGRYLGNRPFWGLRTTRDYRLIKLDFDSLNAWVKSELNNRSSSKVNPTATSSKKLLIGANDLVAWVRERLIADESMQGILSEGDIDQRKAPSQALRDWIEVEASDNRLEIINKVGADNIIDITGIDLENLFNWIKGRLNENEAYAPQPYAQLSKVLRNMGAHAQAKEVEVARYAHRYRSRDHSWQKISDWISWLTIGFGLYPFRLLYWFMLLVVCGFFISFFSSVFQGWGYQQRFWYSLENALPLIELTPQHARIVPREEQVRNFFHFQKIVGYVMATILVGAMTLLGN